MRAGVVGGGERPDDELPPLDRRDRAADVFDDAAVLVTHGSRLAGPIESAIGPQIRAADAARRQPDHRIRGVDNARVRTLVNADIARTVQNSSSHDSIPS